MATKTDGKQSIKAGSDRGAHAAFAKTATPESVKKMASGSTKYKHR